MLVSKFHPSFHFAYDKGSPKDRKSKIQRIYEVSNIFFRVTLNRLIREKFRIQNLVKTNLKVMGGYIPRQRRQVTKVNYLPV